MQAITHRQRCSEGELAHAIATLIAAEHCIESVQREWIDVSVHGEDRTVSAYVIESVTVAGPERGRG